MSRLLRIMIAERLFSQIAGHLLVHHFLIWPFLTGEFSCLWSWACSKPKIFYLWPTSDSVAAMLVLTMWQPLLIDERNAALATLACFILF